MSERHIVNRSIVTLEEALSYITPAPCSKGAIILQAPKLRQASKIIEAEILRLLHDSIPAVAAEEAA